MNHIATTETLGSPPDYDTDFYAWSHEQARRIRLLQIPGLDSPNIAEEIESLGSSQKRELASRMNVLLMHLLKWQFQPGPRTPSWSTTIDNQRSDLELLLNDSPSLRRTVPEVIAGTYPRAIRNTAKETGLPVSSFPPACEWTPEQVLEEDFLPG